jgi:ATP-dependent RNA helicase DeaD
MEQTATMEKMETTEQERKTFGGFGLRKELLKALDDRGFNEPTPVQESVLGQDNLNADLIVRARTGSGKTLAFLLPLMNDDNLDPSRPGVVVISPTRELALQISREAAWVSRGINCPCTSLVGGMDMSSQIRDLRKGVAFVIGTPGRILDHVRRGTLCMDSVHTVVLDEGDHMLDMGFRDELEGILDAASGRKRTWLFSATMPPSVRALSRKYLSDPRMISLVDEGAQHEDINHTVYTTPKNRQMDGLVNVLLWENSTKGLVFCHTRAETIEVANRLTQERFSSCCLHGDMSQRERNHALSMFVSGRVSHLVATNVASRGLDIPEVEHVFQFGLPSDAETFIHRSGRTGRAGNEGRDILVLTMAEAYKLKGMLRNTNISLNWLPVPDSQAIRARQRARYEEKIFSVCSDGLCDTGEWAESLLERSDPVQLVTNLLRIAEKSIRSGYSLKADIEREREREQSSASRRTKSVPERGGKRPMGRRNRGTLVRLAVKDAADWNAGKVLRTVCSALDVSSGDVAEIILGKDKVMVELLPKALEKYNRNPESLSGSALSRIASSGRRRQEPKRDPARTRTA